MLTPAILSAFERARADLASLRLYDRDHDEHSWVPSAGLPMYIGLFARDTLLTGRQSPVLSSDLMRGALAELPRWQGTHNDDWRDEQPGRILHQAQDGPHEVLMFNPLGRYYGEITGSAFYPALVGHLWHWTGRKETIGPFIEPALKALEWLDGYTRLRDDGFYWYQTRSEQGLKNQAWMDSGDSIVYPDGSQVPDPIAACEVQGFAYLAKLCIAEILCWFTWLACEHARQGGRIAGGRHPSRSHSAGR